MAFILQFHFKYLLLFAHSFSSGENLPFQMCYDYFSEGHQLHPQMGFGAQISLQLFKSNPQAPLTFVNALFSSHLLLERLRASILYGLTHPKSWHCLCVYNADGSPLLAKTQVKLSVSDTDACSELSQEMTRGTPWSQQRLLSKCLLYLEGCPSVDRPMWTGFFGLPHWTR